jgi:hypothetical protein
MAKSPKPPPSAPAAQAGRPNTAGRGAAGVSRQGWRRQARWSGIVDAAAADPVPTRATPASVPDFDPATQPICDRATLADMRDRLHNALLELAPGAGRAAVSNSATPISKAS